MKRKIGKAGIALIFGALSVIFGAVVGTAVNDTIDLTRPSKKDGYGKNNS